jgi:hypothetical protein
VGDRRELLIARELAALDDLDAHGVVGLVGEGDRPVEGRSVVKPGVDVAEEIGRRDGGSDGVDLDDDVPGLGPDEDAGDV